MNKCLLLFLLLPLCASALEPEPRQTWFTGTYTDLCYNKDGSDLLGMELMIIPSSAGYSVVVQIAEGGAPYTTVVPITIQGKTASFTLPFGGPYGGMRFEGKLSRTSLAIKWQSGEQETLKRGPSYWQ
ncbi:hypothetical protein [Dyella acidiphila]|uniref:Uncharacterized protein n=1 Tax=Dyella acidiphila TaxID=2775866 RepID=A0ABR9G9V3_9GAMM|nr:hypothetical protein [Dyella acidiphila]MBE1160808.1 hypothetical protein [Dyella acidiphila]